MRRTAGSGDRSVGGRVARGGVVDDGEHLGARARARQSLRRDVAPGARAEAEGQLHEADGVEPVATEVGLGVELEADF